PGAAQRRRLGRHRRLGHQLHRGVSAHPRRSAAASRAHGAAREAADMSRAHGLTAAGAADIMRGKRAASEASEKGRKIMAGRQKISRRSVIKAGGGLAGILALGRAPAFAQGAAAKKVIIAYTSPPPDVVGTALDWYAKAITERSKGELVGQFE